MFKIVKTALDFLNSTPVSAKEKPSVVVTKPKSKKEKCKCEKCEYICQKESTFWKHTETKHADQGCKEKILTFLRLKIKKKIEARQTRQNRRTVTDI